MLDIAESTGTEGLAAAAVVFAVAGSTAQRAWVYERLLPQAGTHVLVTGCASYHAAVDHHLGTLAAALGDTARAADTFRAALAMHERLGAAAWARLTAQALAELTDPHHRAGPTMNSDESTGAGSCPSSSSQAQLPDSKGLQDIATMIAARGADVHVLTLVGDELPRTGADPILDDTAKAHFKSRLNTLAGEIQDAEDAGNTGQAEQLRTERDRTDPHPRHRHRARRPQQTTRRRDRTSRKTVSARVRDAIAKIDHVHPALADHLRRALRMGTVCSYSPNQPTTWTLK